MGAEAAPGVVLVVEDEPLVRENIADELRTYGWQVLEAASGEDALKLVPDNQIDVVFMDIQLAGQMSGWEIADALRAQVPALPILYTSGYACDLARQVAGSLFIRKPYQPGFIIEACYNLMPDPAN
jgi:CheY-like chemotaxis protein